MFLRREGLGCGLVSRGLSRLVFMYLIYLLCVFKAGGTWLWLGLPGSLSSCFYVVNIFVMCF